VIAVHTGYLERKKRFTRTYRESYFVLTPSGFLHEYSSSDPAQANSPLFSLFLPLCTLGPAAGATAKSHKFHIEGRKDGAGTIKTGSLRLGRPGQHAWSFRARSHEDMMEWWNDVRMLCARYLVASDALERSGPVAAAVRAAGYASEEEEEGEEEGSSVEEERHAAEEEEDLPSGAYIHEADEITEPPSYRGHPHGVSELAQAGYLNNDKKSRGTPSPDDGANVSRRPSQRQQEKSPESSPPHAGPDAAAHADGEDETDGAGPAEDSGAGVSGSAGGDNSRFREGL